MLAETDALAAAIDAAAPLYQGAARAEILRLLVHLGAESIAEQQGRHRHVVLQHAGRYPGLNQRGYLDELREEWPE